MSSAISWALPDFTLNKNKPTVQPGNPKQNMFTPQVASHPHCGITSCSDVQMKVIISNILQLRHRVRAEDTSALMLDLF